MECNKCHQDKPNDHFFKPRNVFDKSFFAAGVPDSYTCFTCAGDYCCIRCKGIKPASAFRIGGRICSDCKSAKQTALE